MPKTTPAARLALLTKIRAATAECEAREEDYTEAGETLAAARAAFEDAANDAADAWTLYRDARRALKQLREDYQARTGQPSLT